MIAPRILDGGPPEAGPETFRQHPEGSGASAGGSGTVSTRAIPDSTPSSSSARAAAAALRSTVPTSAVERLPNVPRSAGHTSVSPMTRRTFDRGIPSSAATSADSAVRLSWPTSTLPVNAVTSPSASTWIHAPPVADHASGTAPGGTTTTRPGARTSKKSRSAGPVRSHGVRGRDSKPTGEAGGGGPAGVAVVSPAPDSAARRTARTILGYVQQRQTLPCIASRMASPSGDRVRPSSATASMIIPGVQNPHCMAAVSAKARWTGCRSPPRASPSTVVTGRPSASPRGVTQDRTG